MKSKRKLQDILSQASCKGKKICKVHKYCIAVISILILALISTALIWPGFLKSKADFSINLIQNDWTTDGTKDGVVYVPGEGLELASSPLKWQEGGVTVASGDTVLRQDEQYISDSNGGAYVVWKQKDCVNYNDPGFNMCQDELGATSYYDKTYIQKINGDGEIQWPIGNPNPSGFLIADAVSQYGPSKIMPDGVGGVFVIWIDFYDDGSNLYENIYGKRLNSDGSIYGGWSSSGTPIARVPYPREEQDLQVIPNSLGGFDVFWKYDQVQNYYDIYAQRVNGSGAIQWPVGSVSLNGKRITNIPNGTALRDDKNDNSSYTLADGSGNTYIFWNNGGNSNEQDIYAQKIDGDGEILWPLDPLPSLEGIPVVTATNQQTDFSLTLDISDKDVLVSWIDYRSGNNGSDIYTQKINSNGAIQWPIGNADIGGIPISINTFPGSGYGKSNIDSTLLSTGDFLISWNDNRSGQSDQEHIYAQKINQDGIIQWTPNGDQNGLLIYGTALGAQYVPDVIADDTGGAFITWEGMILDPFATGVSVKRINGDGSTYSGWSDGGIFISDPQLGEGSGFGRQEIIPAGTDEWMVFWKYQLSGTLEYNKIYAQKIGLPEYIPAGTMVSSILDATGIADWKNIDWTLGAGSGGQLGVQIRTAESFPGNLALLDTATASATSSLIIPGVFSLTPDKAKDNSMEFPGNFWVSDDGSTIPPDYPPADFYPQEFEIDWTEAQTVSKIYIKSTTDQQALDSMPSEYSIETWNGSSWDIQCTQANDTDGAPETIECIFPKAKSTTKAKIVMQNCIAGKENGFNQFAFGEFEAYSGGVWSDPNWSGPSITSPGAIPDEIPNGQYIQYKMTLNSASSLSPILQSVTLSGDPSGPEPPIPPNQPNSPSFTPEEINEAPETPAEETGETVTPPVFQSNTLEEVQATLMPDFPADWGIDYIWGRAQWALDHRRGIYQLYLDYLGRAPSSEEVNWQFAHEPNIYNIQFYMLISPEFLSKHK